MKYRIKKETKPTLPTYGKYKAVAVHYQTVESKQIVNETAQRMGTHPANVRGILVSLAEVINNHLREGDRVRLEDWGMMKLEIESDKVDTPEEFNVKKNIRAIRLHVIPESYKGKQEMYEGIELHSAHPEV